MVTDHVPSYESIILTQSRILVFGLGLGHVLFLGDLPCTVIWKHTSIIHTQWHILILGFGLGHMLFLLWLSMYRHMKAYIHHPYSIMHIGIGPLNRTYWYWVLAWAICCFYGDWPCTVIWKHTSIIHTPSCILALGHGLGHMFFFVDGLCTDISRSSILNHAYYIIYIYWVLAWVMWCFYGDWPYVYI